MPTLAAGELEELVRRIFAAAESPAEVARVVAASLVLANLKGVDSHGVMRVPEYVEQIARGRIVPAAEPSVEQAGATVRVDGRWGFGQVAARKAAQLSARLARETGVAVAAVTRVHHVGRLGEYVELVAADGAVGLAFCNTGPPGGRVVPFGGRRAVLPTNPLAYAVPAGARPAIVADFSTSAAAEGRVRLARQNGTEVPEGWLVDGDGQPTRDPEALYAGGALLPAGGHRGYALGLLVELLGGALAGAGCASTGAAPGNGLVLVALDPAARSEPAAFLAEVDAVAAAILAVEPAPGFDRVRLPGEPEAETEARRRAEGIPLDDATWQDLVRAAAGLGVEVSVATDPLLPGEDRRSVPGSPI
jgi:LDH2 family malate/lactate/ureidoglycolate dehydrogenase